MEPKRYRLSTSAYKALAFTIFTALFTIVTILVFVTYLATPGDGLLGTLARHHVALMAVLIIVSVGFGATFSFMLLREIEHRGVAMHVQSDRIEALEKLVRSALTSDERAVIEHLERNPESSQQAIGRLEGMYRVKAHRIIKGLESRGIVSVRSEGKQRYVSLNDAFRTDR